MVPDDIGRRVTLDTLRARVPSGHNAVRVELEDRVIHDGVDETAETRFAVQQTLARLLALRHVARDLGKPEQHAIFVADGVDDGERPETSSVLANTPAFGLEPAGLGSGPQRPFRKSSRPVLRRKESCVGAANDLRRLVAFEALCPGIPRYNQPLRADHVDGIVDHALHEELQLPRVSDVVCAPGVHASPLGGWCLTISNVVDGV